MAAMLSSTGVSSAQAQPAPVAVSRQLAEAQHLAIGATARLSTDAAGPASREYRVVGIYEPTPNPARLGSPDLEVRFHLPDLLDLTRDPTVPEGAEPIDGVNVALVNPTDAQAFSRDLNARLPGVLARPAIEASDNAGAFVVLRRFHLAI